MHSSLKRKRSTLTETGQHEEQTNVRSDSGIPSLALQAQMVRQKPLRSLARFRRRSGSFLGHRETINGFLRGNSGSLATFPGNTTNNGSRHTHKHHGHHEVDAGFETSHQSFPLRSDRFFARFSAVAGGSQHCKQYDSDGYGFEVSKAHVTDMVPLAKRMGLA